MVDDLQPCQLLHHGSLAGQEGWQYITAPWKRDEVYHLRKLIHYSQNDGIYIGRWYPHDEIESQIRPGTIEIYGMGPKAQRVDDEQIFSRIMSDKHHQSH